MIARAIPAVLLTALTIPAPVAAQVLPTPNDERTITIAVLDKVSSEVREFRLKPGEAVDFGKIRIAARACEASPPWERPHSGAFLQIYGAATGQRRARLFSGWLFAESPSLNSFDHQRYDVWVKSCAMRFPESGPDTLVVGRASSAPKSASAIDSAASSN